MSDVFAMLHSFRAQTQNWTSEQQLLYVSFHTESTWSEDHDLMHDVTDSSGANTVIFYLWSTSSQIGLFCFHLSDNVDPPN